MSAGANGDGILRCAGVTAAYGRIQVCHGIDMEVRPGQTTVLLGPNGAGKSSLLGAIAGQVRSTGTVTLGSRHLEGMPAHQRAGAGIAFVPEGRGNCFPTLSVEENLLIAARLANGARANGIQYALELFPILEQRMGQMASTLSGGEQQMLAIGMALARRPKIVMLDEPTQGLAPRIRLQLADVIRKLAATGLGLLVAEQDQAFAERIADDFIVLSGGEVVATGTGDELDRERLAEAYLSAGAAA